MIVEYWVKSGFNGRFEPPCHSRHSHPCKEPEFGDRGGSRLVPRTHLPPWRFGVVLDFLEVVKMSGQYRTFVHIAGVMRLHMAMKQGFRGWITSVCGAVNKARSG